MRLSKSSTPNQEPKRGTNRVRIHDIRPRPVDVSRAKKKIEEPAKSDTTSSEEIPVDAMVIDERKRTLLKAIGGVGLGVVAASFMPRSAEALVMGGTPSTSVVGVKDDANTRINPATEETLEQILSGQGILKKTTVLAASGNVHTPASGKKIRVYANRFSLSADATSVSFRFTSGGTDFEKYSTPKAGGLYGANNHPNYIEGGIDEILYCVISGTTSIQINVDYLEV